MPDNGCDVVVVGASAGGVDALKRVAAALPADFAAPVLVVLHVPATAPSVLPDILGRAGPLVATHARHGEQLVGGHIYIAPPDCHLTVSGDHIELTRGPRENGHRPAIDPLFRSAALVYDSRAAGVVLSGMLDDGTVGLSSIKRANGATLVQSPADAVYPGMPTNAIEYVDPDYVQSVEDLVHTLVRLTSNANGRGGKEAEVEQAPDPASEHAQPGEIAPFQCPECGGTLWEAAENGVPTYRCRVGHAYTLNSLAAEHTLAVEQAMWTAYRALEEHASMSRRVARRLAERGRSESAGRFERQAEISTKQAADLRRILHELEPAPDAAVQAASG